ncbi:hypothetical protein L1887_31068 [Cichorium endivia]|nr:hypothetical protein L1887_31068 [Cichorium endivia]
MGHDLAPQVRPFTPKKTLRFKKRSQQRGTQKAKTKISRTIKSYHPKYPVLIHTFQSPNLIHATPAYFLHLNLSRLLQISRSSSYSQTSCS